MALIAIALTAALLTGCDEDGAESDDRLLKDGDDIAQYDYSSFDTELTDLTQPEDHRRIDLIISPTRRFPSCHQIFEGDDGPVDWPVDDGDTSISLFGCNADGYIEFDDGRRLLSYEIPMDADDRATDLRLTLYDGDGSVRWHQGLDRSHQIDRFAARYRGSFLTVVDDNLACIGTRWMSQTQVLCARLESGRIVYDNRMDFRAGTDLFGFGSSLFGADEDGITRRYPYSGIEMRHRSFDHDGGAGAYYATDKEHIFFVPGADHPVLEAWRLETLQQIWRATVAEVPQRNYQEAIADHRLVFPLVDGRLLGIDAQSGALRMAFGVGDVHPRMTHDDDGIYLLVRREDDGPLVYAVDPEDGDVRWVADAPAGSRDIEATEEGLMTRSVRTVRRIEPNEHAHE